MSPGADPRRPLAIAHRAGNSAAALRAAVDAGAHVVEADVHHHRGSLEVRHLRTMGPVPLLWDTWRLVSASAPLPALAEVLAAAVGHADLMLDIKGRPAAGAAVADLLHEVASERPVIVCSRAWRSLDPFRDVPWVRTVLSARTRAELGALRAAVRGRGAYGVSVHRSLLDRAVVRELLDSVEVVMAWPVNDIGTLDRMLEIGALGIISDEPDIVRRVRQMRG